MVDGDIVCIELKLLISLTAKQESRENENAGNFSFYHYLLVGGSSCCGKFCVIKTRLQKKKSFHRLIKIALKLSCAADYLAKILLHMSNHATL